MVDSDNEMSPAYFFELWSRRDSYEALFSTRTGRVQNLGRKIISSVSRKTVGLIYGRGMVDVNVPYRPAACDNNR